MNLEQLLDAKVSGTEVEDKNFDKLKEYIDNNFDGVDVRQLSATEKYSFRSTGSMILDLQLGGGFLKGGIVEVFGEASSGKTTTAVTSIRAMQDMYDYKVVELLVKLIELEGSEINPRKFEGRMSKIIESTAEDKQRKKYGYFAKVLEACNYNNAKGESLDIVNEINDIIKNKGKAIYFDAEGALSGDWSVRMGIDSDKVTKVSVHVAENLFDQLEEALRLFIYEIVVIDSIGALTVNAENDSSMDQQSMGLLARVLSKGMRKVGFNSELIANSPVQPTIICVNHIYQTMDQWKPIATPGGEKMKFAYSTRLEVKRIGSKFVYAGDEVDEDALIEDADEQIGTYVRFKVHKNKVTAPKSAEETKVIFKKPLLEDGTQYDKMSIGYNKYEEIYDVLESKGIIQAESSRTFFIEDALLDDDLIVENLTFRKGEKKHGTVDRWTGFSKAIKKELKFNPGFFKSCKNELDRLTVIVHKAFDLEEDVTIDDLI